MAAFQHISYTVLNYPVQSVLIRTISSTIKLPHKQMSAGRNEPRLSAKTVPDWLSSSGTVGSSPKNIRLAKLRRYQAFGNARISSKRRISYLKDAEPISHTATSNNPES